MTDDTLPGRLPRFSRPVGHLDRRIGRATSDRTRSPGVLERFSGVLAPLRRTDDSLRVAFAYLVGWPLLVDSTTVSERRPPRAGRPDRSATPVPVVNRTYVSYRSPWTSPETDDPVRRPPVREGVDVRGVDVQGVTTQETEARPAPLRSRTGPTNSPYVFGTTRTTDARPYPPRGALGLTLTVGAPLTLRTPATGRESHHTSAADRTASVRRSSGATGGTERVDQTAAHERPSLAGREPALRDPPHQTPGPTVPTVVLSRVAESPAHDRAGRGPAPTVTDRTPPSGHEPGGVARSRTGHVSGGTPHSRLRATPTVGAPYHPVVRRVDAQHGPDVAHATEVGYGPHVHVPVRSTSAVPTPLRVSRLRRSDGPGDDRGSTRPDGRTRGPVPGDGSEESVGPNEPTVPLGRRPRTHPVTTPTLAVVPMLDLPPARARPSVHEVRRAGPGFTTVTGARGRASTRRVVSRTPTRTGRGTGPGRARTDPVVHARSGTSEGTSAFEPRVVTPVQAGGRHSTTPTTVLRGRSGVDGERETRVDGRGPGRPAAGSLEGEGGVPSTRSPLVAERTLAPAGPGDSADGDGPGRATRPGWTVLRGGGRVPGAAHGAVAAPAGVGVPPPEGSPTMTVRRGGTDRPGRSDHGSAGEPSADRARSQGGARAAPGADPGERATFDGVPPTRGPDVDRFVDRFYRRLEWKMRVERERRGL